MLSDNRQQCPAGNKQVAHERLQGELFSEEYDGENNGEYDAHLSTATTFVLAPIRRAL